MHCKPSLFTSIAVLLLAAMPIQADAQLGRIADRARRAAERTVNQTVDRTAENATQNAMNNAMPGRDNVIEAARTVVRAYEETAEDFSPPGHSFDFSYYNDWPQGGEEMLASIEALENRYPEWQEPMQVLAEQYGNDGHQVRSGLLDAGIREHEYGGGTNAGSAFNSMVDRMEKVAQFRRDAAERSASNADMMFRLLEERFQMTEIRVNEAEQVKDELELAHRYDPNNIQVNSLLAVIDEKIDAVRQDVEAEIDAGEWPENGPGAPTQFLNDVLAYFRAHEEWGAKPDVDVLAVAIRSTWEIAEQNVLGQVTQWRLPVAVAATKPIWRESDAARVYELSILANPGLPAAQSPPFWGYWVGDSHLARLNKIPSM